MQVPQATHSSDTVAIFLDIGIFPITRPGQPGLDANDAQYPVPG